MHEYSDVFFDYIEAGSSRSAGRIVPFVQRELRVRSVVDVGCGRGVWLREWIRSGVRDAIGVDGDYVNRETIVVPGECFTTTDLGKPFSLSRRFDLAVCLEVAEHLPETASRALIDSLCRHSDMVLFSAAPPGQGGENHVNERPFEYWRGIFQGFGYNAYDWLRPLLRDAHDVEPWYRYNVFLYAKSSVHADLPDAVKQALVPADVRLPDVSPITFKLRKFVLSRLPQSGVTALAKLYHRLSLTLGASGPDDERKHRA
jgi:hypothetical protein